MKQIKIELPPNIKVTCPTPETALIILRSLSYKQKDGDRNGLGGQPYPNAEQTRREWCPPVVNTGRPQEGEGFSVGVAAAAALDDADSIPPQSGTIDAQFEEEMVPEIPEVEHPSESEILDAEEQEFNRYQEKLDSDDEEDDTTFVGGEETDEEEEEQEFEIDTHKGMNTRSRFSASLVDPEEEEEEGEGVYVNEGANQIFQPVDSRSKENTLRVFEFIQERLMFTTKQVRKFAKKELGMKMNDKNKQRLKDELKAAETLGLIERTPSGSWQRVS